MKPRFSISVRRAAATACAAIVVAAIGLSAPAQAQTVCRTDYSGYYCYYTGTSRGGDNWTHDSCWQDQIKSYPLWLRDSVRSWDHRQTGGAFIRNLNWKSNSNRWEFVFSMSGQTYRSNQPYESPRSAGADALLNINC